MQVCAFHLKNKHSNRGLKISWNGTILEHCDNQVYLGVTLDRSLTYKAHVNKLIGKVSARKAAGCPAMQYILSTRSQFTHEPGRMACTYELLVKPCLHWTFFGKTY